MTALHAQTTWTLPTALTAKIAVAMTLALTATSVASMQEQTSNPAETPAPIAGTATESAETTTEGAGGQQAALIGGAATGVADAGLGWLEHQIVRVLPYYEDAPYLQFITVVLLFLLLATVVSFLSKRLAQIWFHKTETDLDDNLLSALTPPIYSSMIALGLRVGVERLQLSPGLETGISRSLGTFVVMVWLIAVFQISSLLLRALAENDRHFPIIRRNTAPLFDNLSKIVLFLVAAYLVIEIWDGNISGLLAAGGVAGLAVGFAARDTLANLFAGIFIFADSPYKIGDYIVLDSGERGKVTMIGIRSTRVLTRDDVEVTIPNAVMGNAKIVNESGGPHPKYRIRIKVGVAYGSDIDRVRSLLVELAAAEPLVCPDPSPRVRFRAFGESSLDFELLCWVQEPELRGRAIDSQLTAIYKRFAAEEIEIPYAKRDLYIKEMPVALGERTGARQREEPDPPAQA